MAGLMEKHKKDITLGEGITKLLWCELINVCDNEKNCGEKVWLSANDKKAIKDRLKRKWCNLVDDRREKFEIFNVNENWVQINFFIASQLKEVKSLFFQFNIRGKEVYYYWYMKFNDGNVGFERAENPYYLIETNELSEKTKNILKAEHNNTKQGQIVYKFLNNEGLVDKFFNQIFR